jgi:hypothetical protein
LWRRPRPKLGCGANERKKEVNEYNLGIQFVNTIHECSS